jgi:hypothetical protein
MIENSDQHRNWLDLIALIMSFLGMIVSVIGALSILAYQAQISSTPVWPLPGYVLLDWAIVGLIGFLAAFVSFIQYAGKWLSLAWLITGTLIPLIVLGLISIGPFVLIAFIFFVTATINITIRKREKWLLNMGLLLLGAAVNAGILTLIITLGSLSYGQ